MVMKKTTEFLVLAALAGVLSGCHKRNEPPAAPPLPTVPVRLQKVEAKTYPAIEEVVGTVRAKMKSSISAKVSGRIEKLLVAPGQKVKAGDLLLQLDVGEIQAQLQRAQAVQKQAAIELERMKSLFAQATVARAEVDRAEMQFQVAVGNVKEVETMLGYARVTAPFDGVVTRKIADVGDLASPGLALLEMEDPNLLRLEAEVPEALIDRVKLGDQFTVRIASLPQLLEAVVGEMDPVADPVSRTFNVKMDLPQATGLRSGLFGRVAIPVSQTTTLRVPASALVVRGQMEIVFVANKGAAQLRLVKTGKRIGEEIEVVSGLNAGEEVVVDNAPRLRDGQPLTRQ